MDPIAGALCAMGAATLALGRGSSSNLVAALILGGAFYGVFRATRSTSALALVGAPALAWGLGGAWDFAPRALVNLSMEHPALRSASAWLAMAVMTAAFVASVVIARRKIGWGLAGLTIAALGVALVTRTLAALVPHPDSAPGVLLGSTAQGWAGVAETLAAASWIVLAVSPPPVQPLARRAGVLAGALGAALLAAVLLAESRRGSAETVVTALVLLTFVVAWSLCAVGLGAIGRTGVAAGWVGVGLVVVQLLALVPALLIFEQGRLGYVVQLSTMFGLSGLVVTLLGAKTFPFREVRVLSATLLAVGAVGTFVAWGVLWVGLKRIVRIDEPGWLLDRIVQPTAVVGLVILAAYAAFIAVPPEGSSAAATPPR